MATVVTGQLLAGRALLFPASATCTGHRALEAKEQSATQELYQDGHSTDVDTDAAAPRAAC